MAELFQKNGRACVVGVEVLRWRISLPSCNEKIAAFYEKIGTRVVGFCEGVLREKAEREFEASEDEKKRFQFPTLSYRLEGKITYEDETYLSVCLAAELRHRGERSPVGFFEDGQVFEKESGMLLAPEDVVFRFCGERLSAKEKKSARGVLLSENAVLWHDGTRWQTKAFEKTKGRGAT
ncbi:MAG: hypothetical protein IJD64_06170 [Clostridia bacterium]|nr:hypothetical protein [Clostridia bacterium]